MVVTVYNVVRWEESAPLELRVQQAQQGMAGFDCMDSPLMTDNPYGFDIAIPFNPGILNRPMCYTGVIPSL